MRLAARASGSFVAENRGMRLVTAIDFMRECRRVFEKEQKKKEEWARRAKDIMCLLLTPEQVARFELKGDPTEVSGTKSVKQFIAEGGSGKAWRAGAGLRAARAIHA
jgi:hypothetical protein